MAGSSRRTRSARIGCRARRRPSSRLTRGSWHRSWRTGCVRGLCCRPGTVRRRRIAEALRKPAFTLYLGRQSCPLSSPPDPRIVQAEGALQVPEQAGMPPVRDNGTIRLIASDDRIGAGDMEERRNDVAPDTPCCPEPCIAENIPPGCLPNALQPSKTSGPTCAPTPSSTPTMKSSMPVATPGSSSQPTQPPSLP